MKFNSILIIGFAGVGKTAIAQDLEKYDKSNYHKVITSTTREIRNGEREGVDYFFDTKDNFKQRVKNGEFLEHAIFNGNYYGTPISSFSEKKINLVVCEPSGVMSLYNNPKIKILHVVNIERDFSLVLNSVNDEKRVRQITLRRANKEEEKELDKIPAFIKNQIITFENNYPDVRYATLAFNKIFNMNTVVNLYDYGVSDFLQENIKGLKKSNRKTKNQGLSFAIESLIKEGLDLAAIYSDDLKKSNDKLYMSKVNSFIDNLDVVKAFHENKGNVSNLLVEKTFMEIYNRASILNRFSKISEFYEYSKDKWSEDKKFLFKNLSKEIVQIKNSNGFIEKKNFKSIEKSLESLSNYKQIIDKKILNPIVLNSSFIIDYITCQYDKYKKNHLRIVLDEKKMDYLHNDVIYKLFLNDGKKITLNALVSIDNCISVYKDNKTLITFDMDDKKLELLSMEKEELIDFLKSNKEYVKAIPYTMQTPTFYKQLRDEGIIDSNFKPELYIKSLKTREELLRIEQNNIDADVVSSLNK